MGINEIDHTRTADQCDEQQGSPNRANAVIGENEGLHPFPLYF